MHPTDLHPDDLAYRIGLRDMLIARREQLGYSQAHLARLIDRTQGAVAQFETRQSSRIELAQEIAYPLRLRIVLHPDNLPGGPYTMPDFDLTRKPEQQHLLDRRCLVRNMVTARKAQGVTQAALAGRLGIHVNVLARLESNRTGALMLATCQRYLRALDGELWIGADDLDPHLSVFMTLNGSAAA